MSMKVESETEILNGVAPRERAPRPVASGTRIGHVHLKTADIDRIHHFYVEILGKGGSPPPPGTTGLYHVAILYPTRAALGDALRRLAEAGWPLDGVNDHGTHEALYLRDPDGNGLELAWDRPEDEWPKDKDGHLSFSGNRLDLEGLLKEGLEPAS